VVRHPIVVGVPAAASGGPAGDRRRGWHRRCSNKGMRDELMRKGRNAKAA